MKYITLCYIFSIFVINVTIMAVLTKIRMSNRNSWSVQESVEDILLQIYPDTYHYRCLVHLSNGRPITLLSRHIASLEDLR